MLLFLLFNWVVLAPWDWDNIKLLIWPYMAMLGLVSRVLQQTPIAFRTAGDSKPIAVISNLVLAVILGLSGTVSILSSLDPQRAGIGVCPSAELQDTQGAIYTVPGDSLFIAAPTYNQPLTNWGAIRVLGYGCYTWSHGIDSNRQAELQRRLYSGSEEWRNILSELDATHIVLEPHERNTYGTAALPWLDTFENVSEVAECAVYKIQ